jgi:hypothetical protein
MMGSSTASRLGGIVRLGSVAANAEALVRSSAIARKILGFHRACEFGLIRIF